MPKHILNPNLYGLNYSVFSAVFFLFLWGNKNLFPTKQRQDLLDGSNNFKLVYKDLGEWEDTE